MIGVGPPSGRSFDRRLGSRVQLAVPVQLNKVAAQEGGVVPAYTGQTIDLSTSGAYVTTKAKGSFVPGEIVLVSIGIPWEFRGTFPFSRIIGSSRIVRVEPHQSDEETAQGLALAFCGNHVTFLGAIVTPT